MGKTKVNNGFVMIKCPGCNEMHACNIDSTRNMPKWEFNKDLQNPTISPSILVLPANWPDGTQAVKRCHSFVKNEKIQFLNDCDYELKGQTVILKEWSD